MKTNRLFTIMVVALISMFLLISGTTIAFRGNRLSSEPVLTEDDDDYEDDYEEEDDDDYEEDYDDDDDDDYDDYDEGKGRRRGVGRRWDGTQGTFVSFELLENGVKNYTLHTNNTDLHLFESVIIPDLEIDDIERKGALFEMEGEDTDLRIYDVAPALMKIDAETDHDDYLNPDQDSLIGHYEAIDIAYQQANGTLIELELDEDDGSYIYEIEIVNENTSFEFEIDAYTGDLLEFETDEEDDFDLDWDELIGHEAALTKAYELANGTLIDFELDDDMYEIEILGENKEYDIEIDAYTGNIVSLDVEDRKDQPRTVSFNLGDLEVVEQDGPNLVLAYEDYTARLLSITEGDGQWEDSLEISTTNGFVNYTFTEDLFLVFRMTDFEMQKREREREREMERNISNSISQGKIGGEVIIDRDEKGFSEMSVSYSDMQMMTQVRNKDRIQITVSSDTLGSEGKIIAAKMYREAFNIDSLEELEITFDGEEIEMAEDYEDLLGSDEAKYLVSMGSEKIEVLVMVPHFSTHTIDIARNEIGSLLDFQYFLPVVAITALIVIATVWIVKKEN
ncbi:MAG: PepSY domain-containing protein [Thermoplasmatota archaeon]